MITFMQANLQRASLSSDDSRLETFWSELDRKKPDLLFLQEVGEDFGEHPNFALKDYSLVAIAKNPKKGGEASQLNVAVLRRNASKITISRSEVVEIERTHTLKPYQRRKGVSVQAKSAGIAVDFLVVHADATDAGGIAMVHHFNKKLGANKRFVGVGDVNFDLNKLSEKITTDDKIAKRIAAPMNDDGSYAATHVSYRDNVERTSTLDFSMHGSGVEIEYEKPVRSVHTKSLRIPRAASVANATNDRLVDHHILSASVKILSEAQALKRSDEIGAGRPMPKRLIGVAAEDRKKVSSLKRQLAPYANGDKIILGKRENDKRRKIETELEALTSQDESGDIAAPKPSFSRKPAISVKRRRQAAGKKLAIADSE